MNDIDNDMNRTKYLYVYHFSMDVSYIRKDVIAHVPPHWRDNVVEEVGSRWAGQVHFIITVITITIIIITCPYHLHDQILLIIIRV